MLKSVFLTKTKTKTKNFVDHNLGVRNVATCVISDKSLVKCGSKGGNIKQASNFSASRECQCIYIYISSSNVDLFNAEINGT